MLHGQQNVSKLRELIQVKVQEANAIKGSGKENWHNSIG
jgi:hypothetical protein